MVIEFGVVLAQQGRSYDELRTIAVEAEQAGFDSIWIYDHLFWSNEPLLEGWTTLSALAREVRKIRLGTLVTCYSYRQPSLVAKMSATLDNISQGRLVLGLGAGTSLGFHSREVISYGFPFPAADVRIEQLCEYIELIRKMWTVNEATYTGRYYQVDKAICYPKPVQKPGPPIIVAGGTDRFLKLTADLADGFNFWGAPDKYATMIANLNGLCQSNGRVPKSLQKSWHISGVIDENPETVKKRLAYHKEMDIIREPMFGGLPDDWVTLFEKYIRIGVTSFQIWFLDAPTPLRLFSREVISRLRNKDTP